VVTKYIFNSIEFKSIEIATILSVTFCPYHFVQYHFVWSPRGWWGNGGTFSPIKEIDETVCDLFRWKEQAYMYCLCWWWCCLLFCSDIDECEERRRGGCSDECLNTHGSYECICPRGYKVDAN